MMHVLMVITTMNNTAVLVRSNLGSTSSENLRQLSRKAVSNQCRNGAPARDQNCCLTCSHALWHQYSSELDTFAAKGLYAARETVLSER